ncbi:T9SS type A sorting domain-containing protein [Fluviicola taffensis]|uniref:Secretion system C-terminal sorting domain-containing protein n=1 Tax=Fluviicola taffensis (strain DSM 16823 / NCIMB 13979 / RW262) TaxID=755732 RepID=F2II95_FLUTR|nr:T9SS type A sorting domain-containing protein [Fluviicola taffensis]AEA43804.1 hypothetical protein Fluta_1817 [Fluviicola taffensis DSM 16823]
MCFIERALFSILCLLLLSTCTKFGKTDTAKGRVLNPVTGEGISGVELKLLKSTADLLHVALDIGEITIYNAQGQEQKTNVIGTDRAYQTLDVSTYASGVYIIVSRKGDAPIKFVKL